jgi:hypothetical protein
MELALAVYVFHLKHYLISMWLAVSGASFDVKGGCVRNWTF